ncbi:MAG: methionyl-tRNA formyltransferase [Methanocalculaceae archaeon]|nr:methionyl-tRNA formyltransferase [Methanocalculaceae archaeon]
MGTSAYAVPALEAIATCLKIAGVVTRPDKPNRRGNKIAFSPVKEFALSHGIPIFQPESMKDPMLYAEFAALRPDICVAAAFGMMIPDEIIQLPKYKTINIHGSLLPHYRGAAPIQHAILNGDTETGVSVMYITRELDAGDVILAKSLPLGQDETFGEVHDRLAQLGAEAVLEALDLIGCGHSVCTVPQDAAKATYAPSITKEECVLDWSLPTGMIHNRIRALSPTPCANTRMPDKKLLKIYRSELVPGNYAGKPGEVVDVLKKKGPVVATGTGVICIVSAKPEGKREMPGFELVNGHYLATGELLG